MPRLRRPRVANGIYHVVTRGVRKQPIYLDDADRRLFVRLLGKVAREGRWTVHVFALMTNHYHLVVQTPDADL